MGSREGGSEAGAGGSGGFLGRSGGVRGRGDRPRRRRRPRQGVEVSALPRSLPCMLLTAGWPDAGDPTGPGVPLPLPPPEPPPPLGLGAAIVGSEEPSGAAAAAMQQARPLARPRGAASAVLAPPLACPGHASDTPPASLTRSRTRC